MSKNRRSITHVLRNVLLVPLYAWLVFLTYGFALAYIGYLSMAAPYSDAPIGGGYKYLVEVPYDDSFTTSIWISLSTALISTLLAIALAWIAHTRFSSREKLSFLLILLSPLLINHYVRISAIRLLLSPNSDLSFLIRSVFPGLGIRYSRGLMIGGLLSWTVPVSTLIIYARVSRISLDSLRAAKNLGATVLKCHKYIVIPHIKLEIIIASIFSFSFAITDNFSNQILNNNHDYLISGVIGDLLKLQDWTMISVLSVSVVLLEVGMLLLAMLMSLRARTQ